MIGYLLKKSYYLKNQFLNFSSKDIESDKFCYIWRPLLKILDVIKTTCLSAVLKMNHQHFIAKSYIHSALAIPTYKLLQTYIKTLLNK